MSSPPQDDLSSFAFPGCDYADCACDLHHEGGLNINNIEFDGAQMPSLEFANVVPSPNPTDSSDSPGWVEVQEDAPSPTESNFVTGPVITFVRTERKERRKAQNREAQRAYRSRKDEQLKALKQELVEMSKQLKTVTEAYNSARLENTLLSCVVQELQQNLAQKS